MIDQLEVISLRDRAIASFILWRVWHHLLAHRDYRSMNTVSALCVSLVNPDDGKPLDCDVWKTVCDCFEWTNKQGQFYIPSGECEVER